METIKAALALYGANLSDTGFITRNTLTTGVKPVLRGKRIRFESVTGRLLASGPISIDAVCHFVEAFWFWKKLADE